MRRHITRALYTAAAAVITLGTLGFAGAGSPATAASRSIGPPGYSPSWAGYSVGGGRWFRFISTTVTVPPVLGGSGPVIGLSHGLPVGEPFAELEVEPGPGGTISAHVSPGGYGTLPLSPRVGDQLALSIYYDQHGHDYFTASDTTQHVTRTIRLTAGSVIYNHGFMIGGGAGPDYPPQADTRLVQFTGSRVTTYTGVRGMLTGPWATWKYITTTTGTAAGTVIASPSELSNGGANFGVWLRAVPATYTSGFAGYSNSIGPFRFIATTMTVPAAQTPAGNGTALVSLGHNGGATPRPYADITVVPGGGAGSISYASNDARGAFTVNPAPGDQVSVGIFYDQSGHYSFTATDTTQGTTQTVTIAAPYAGSMPLNSAEVLAMFSNGTVIPPADAQIWQFTGSKVTTYRGDHGCSSSPTPSCARITP
jgi:Peptidase A4 family